MAEAFLPPRGLQHSVPFVVTINPWVIVTAKEAESIVRFCDASNSYQGFLALLIAPSLTFQPLLRDTQVACKKHTTQGNQHGGFCVQGSDTFDHIISCPTSGENTPGHRKRAQASKYLWYKQARSILCLHFLIRILAIAEI